MFDIYGFIKRLIMLGVVVVIVVVVFNKLIWKTPFMRSQGTLDQSSVPEIGGDDEDMLSHNCDHAAHDVSSYNEQIIENSYLGVTDLRNLLLNKKINASDVVKEKSLLPKTIKIPEPKAMK